MAKSETAGESKAMWILTFVTATGRRCAYAACTGSLGVLPSPLPIEVQSQLDALGAQLAWRYAAPSRTCVPERAADRCEPVVALPSDALGHLTIE